MRSLQRGIELGHHVVGDLRFVVPVGIVLGEGDALALDRVADDRRSAGRRASGSRRNTLRSASTSWPSTSTAAKSKARHLSSSGSRSWISRVGPADWILL